MSENTDIRKSISFTVLAFFLLFAFSILPISIYRTSAADFTGPKLNDAQSNPTIVQYGLQPMESPLVLSVRASGPGGEISRVAIDLSQLQGAICYDPISNTYADAGVDIPMQRTYIIDGQEAYLIELGSRHEYNIYRTASTHEILRGSAISTNKWQVEVPHAGNIKSTFNLAVMAFNVNGYVGSTKIPLTVVDDTVPPQICAEARFTINSSVCQAGGTVIIEARVEDELTDIHSVSLVRDGALSMFGERPNLSLTRELNSDIWRVTNTLAANTLPGIYSIEISATDRAGNVTIHSLPIEVADKVSSLQIELVEGWNLISVPRPLVNPVASILFSGIPVEGIFTVQSGQKTEVNKIEPGIGYLVKATQEAILTVNFADYDVSTTPLVMEIGEGWNLIGYASQALEPVMPLTFYLGDDLKGEWLIVYNDQGAQARPKSTSPYIWATDNFPTITGEPFSWDTTNNLPMVEIGKGYWLYLDDAGILIP